MSVIIILSRLSVISFESYCPDITDIQTADRLLYLDS